MSKRKGKQRGKPDWTEIERLYVQGEDRQTADGTVERYMPSYRDLAERFGLRTASVADHGRINAWPRKREEFGQTLLSTADQARIATVSRAVARSAKRSMELADMIFDAIEARLQQDRIARATEIDLTGKTKEEIGLIEMARRRNMLDPTGLQRCASAVKLCIETQRLELGLDAMGNGNGAGGSSEGAQDRKRKHYSDTLKERVLDELFALNQSPTGGGSTEAGD